MMEFRMEQEMMTTEGKVMLSVDAKIGKGAFVTIYGPSGAGKTTILRMLAGLISPKTGFIRFGDEIWLDVQQHKEKRPQERSIGIVFQDYALFPNMTVKQNLLYAGGKGADAQHLAELVKMTELEQLEDRKPGTLSGGQQQRVALARALVRKPKLLLLDEPLSALDHEMRMRLQDYILRLHRQFGLTTILVSHDLPEIWKMSDQILMLEAGKIVQRGSPDEVFATRRMSGKYQMTGEVLSIEKSDIVYIVSVQIGTSVVKVIATGDEVAELHPGSRVLVSSKAFNPLIRRV